MSSEGVRTSTLCRLALVLLTALPVRAETLVALVSDGTLRYFSSTSPGAYIKTVAITGMQAGDTVAGMDFRPDGTLVVFGKDAATVRPYDVNLNTGVATQGPFGGTPVGTTQAIAFDAFASETHTSNLALVGDDQKMRRFHYKLSSISGSLSALSLFYDNSAADGDPVDAHSGAVPAVVALASTNSFVHAESSVLYGIDSDLDTLVKIDWETGSMDTVASIRTSGGSAINFGTRVGFDISAVTANAYVSRGTDDTFATLLKIDLTTGVTTNVGTIGPAFQQAGVNVVDISVPPPTAVANISTRSQVGSGDNVMIAGFTTQGGATTRLIIRGIGPSLSAFGVPGALADPVLTIFDGNGAQIATNDSWKSNQQTEISQSGLAPSNDAEAAYIGTFAPGQYTAKVSGNNGGTGVGLVEIYKLPDL